MQRKERGGGVGDEEEEEVDVSVVLTEDDTVFAKSFFFLCPISNLNEVK